MIFNSFHFIFFFLVVFVLYYQLPRRFRVPILLLSSCYFYMAFVPVYILILFFLIITDYLVGLAMEKIEGWRRKWLFIVSIVVNLGTLFIFKYFEFFSQNISALAKFLQWNYSPVVLQIVLPIGLSFHIFQSLSYTIEVYRKKQKAESNIWHYALYVMFFPQLVAGPIERPQHLLPQFLENHDFDITRIKQGLELMLWGFFKKLVIADNIAQLVNHVYGNLTHEPGLALGLAFVLFPYQLYCDFSGYSDIAVGSALVFGYKLTANFDRPYVSRSIGEFWRRWHISLSNWLRDYLYYPLTFSGKKLTKARTYISLITTFLLIGLWHGANWTYVVMGGLHGLYLVIGLMTASWRERLVKLTKFSVWTGFYKLWQILTTFILVSISFVFFRAQNVHQAWYFLATLTKDLAQKFQLFDWRFQVLSESVLGIKKRDLIIILAMIIFLEIIQAFQSRFKTPYLFDRQPRYVRLAWYYTLCIFILLFGYFGSQSFIYFQF